MVSSLLSPLWVLVDGAKVLYRLLLLLLIYTGYGHNHHKRQRREGGERERETEDLGERRVTLPTSE